MAKLEFPKLTADDIEVRIGMINRGGVSLLLYKNARVDMKILNNHPDIGPLRWQRHHTRDNANCIVSIYDPETEQWVDKEDTGVASNTEKEKGLASDSFKRACTNLGIGIELYTAPNLFIPKDKLQHYAEDNGKFKCNDSFSVKSITYKGDVIDTVVIGVSYYGKEYTSLSFTNFGTSSTQNSENKAAPSIAPQTKSTAKQPENKPAEATTTPMTGEDIVADDEVLLFGNCRGIPFKEAKTRGNWGSFLKWFSENHPRYEDDAKKDDQSRRLYNMVQKGLVA